MAITSFALDTEVPVTTVDVFSNNAPSVPLSATGLSGTGQMLLSFNSITDATTRTFTCSGLTHLGCISNCHSHWHNNTTQPR